jgi:GntR family histidine utilization transcriptional repressor
MASRPILEQHVKQPDQTQRRPVFQVIKDHLLAQIHAGQWKEGEAVPSEQALAAQFGVARMTVNRAVRELTAEQVLFRIQGSGTYVAPQKVQSTLVAIRNIAEEVAARGHRHRSQVHLMAREAATEAIAAQFGLKRKQSLFHSVIVHFENALPIQVEDRWVNPALAPAYLKQDFSVTTPNAYLVAVAPLQGVNYSIEALPPPPPVAQMLSMAPHESCLVLKRRTWSRTLVASVVTMWHPGSRYQFAGSF